MQDAVEDISKSTTIFDNSKIRENAKIVLKKILHNYSDFAVMTIDSFVFKIVNTFSLELDLPLNFEVEMSTKHIITKTVNSLIEQADEFNYIGKTLKTFIFSKIEKSESWNYEQNISDIGKELFSEQSVKYLDELANLTDEDFLKIIQVLEDKQYEFQNNINNMAKEAVNIIEKANLNPDDFKYKKTSIANKFYKLSKAFKLKDFELGKRFSEDKSSNWVKDDSEFCSLIENLRDNHLENLRKNIVDFYNKNIKTYTSIIIILKDFPLTSLIRKLKILVEAYKKNNNIVPISDFNKIVSDIIKKEIIPFIYWRVGNKYENYLLDEFQDTSSMQLNNLFPLIENSYSSGFHNIAVGDPKQSIYRWRASSPDIMNSEIESLVSNPFLIHKRLEYNYRSNKNIIEFNNLFFSDIFTEINENFNFEQNSNNNSNNKSDNIYSEKNIVQKITKNTPPKIGKKQIKILKIILINGKISFLMSLHLLKKVSY
jgi:ATP-dependent exoDNAse (exonuclease V) beta subunit